MFKNLRTLGAALLVGLVAAFSTIAPAGATINPVVTLLTNSPLGFGGAPGVGRIVVGTITFGASDTYVAGGFTLNAAALAGQIGVQQFLVGSPSANLEVATQISAGSVVIKFTTQMQGVSNMTSGQTTKTVTIPAGFSANDVLTVNTPIYVTLNDAATGGGGSGTWAVTNAVSTVKEASASTFTLTTIAAAPASNGNFVWFIPNLAMEAAAGTPMASYVVPFTAIIL